MEERVFPLDNVTFEGPMIVRVYTETEKQSALVTEANDEAFWLEVRRFVNALSISIERETLAMENDKIFAKLDIQEKQETGISRNRQHAHTFLIKLSDCPDVLDGIYRSFITFMDRLDDLGMCAVCELTVIF